MGALLEFLLQPLRHLLNWLLPHKMSSIIFGTIITVVMLVLLFMVNWMKLQRYFG
jgi:hypothetical protein